MQGEARANSVSVAQTPTSVRALMTEDHDSGTQSPRPETPEPSSIQGRRNAGVQLLDNEGGISDQVRHARGLYIGFLTF